MFSSQKRIFAGKQQLRSEPFCPYLTDPNGRDNLFKNPHLFKPGTSLPHTRPFFRDGKPHV